MSDGSKIKNKMCRRESSNSCGSASVSTYLCVFERENDFDSEVWWLFSGATPRYGKCPFKLYPFAWESWALVKADLLLLSTFSHACIGWVVQLMNVLRSSGLLTCTLTAFKMGDLGMKNLYFSLAIRCLCVRVCSLPNNSTKYALIYLIVDTWKNFRSGWQIPSGHLKTWCKVLEALKQWSLIRFLMVFLFSVTFVIFKNQYLQNAFIMLFFNN